MQRAGSGAASEIRRRYHERLRDGVTIFTGPGNNGGDGWVVAGELAKNGVAVTVIETAAPSEKSPDAKAARDAASKAVGVSDKAPREGSVVVDALLGTGFEGEPRGAIASAISAINKLRGDGRRVIALDVPSGLDATTGDHSECVMADLTASFGGIKRGSLLARDCCGEIIAIDIGLDNDLSGAATRDLNRLPALIDAQWVQSRIPHIAYDAHKGSRKHLAILGGGKGMPGAVVLATHAALRSGIGLVRTMVDPENQSAVLAATPSALNASWPGSVSEIESEISKWADALVLGPGLGKTPETKRLVESVLSNTRVPVLLDADALNVFEGERQSLARLLSGRPALLTPHVAEFARLVGADTKTVTANRFDIGVDIARELGATVLLKGSPTVVFAADGGRYVIPRGTAALGTGGSGDLLAGIAGTLLAQTADATVAGCCAAWVHGRAAEFCSYVRGTTLDDILFALPRAWNESEPAPPPPILAVIPAVAV